MMEEMKRKQEEEIDERRLAKQVSLKQKTDLLFRQRTMEESKRKALA